MQMVTTSPCIIMLTLVVVYLQIKFKTNLDLKKEFPSPLTGADILMVM